MNLNSRPKNSPMYQIWAWSSNYLENNSSFLVFSNQRMTWHTGNKRLLWQHLTTMVIDKIRKVSIKGVKLKSESFFSISSGILELWRKTLGGRISPPPGPDRVKGKVHPQHVVPRCKFWYYQKNRDANVEKIFRPCPLPVVTTSRHFCRSAQLGFSFTNHCFDNRTPAWRIIWITARLFTDKRPLCLSHWWLVKTASLVRTSIFW